MNKKNVIDFDKFLAEREQDTKTVRIFGRECIVPCELPFIYMLKVIRMVEQGETISGPDNVGVLMEMFSKEDFDFITNQASFTMKSVFQLIRKIWLDSEEDNATENDEITEDSLAAQDKGDRKGKKD